MAFSTKQIRQLRARIKPSQIKERDVGGKVLHYIEGWYALAEANRIFGFDGWDRETLSSQCVWQKFIDGRYGVAYLTRVRVSVRAANAVVLREGVGSGEAFAPTLGQAHERAAKAAETDATKRALATFGNPFGLSLYGERLDRTAAVAAGTKSASTRAAQPSDQIFRAAGMDSKQHAPPVRETLTSKSPVAATNDNSQPTLSARVGQKVLIPATAHILPPEQPRIDKSALLLGEPKRLRSPDHLRFVARQVCLVCGRQPCQAHHLRYAQPRALSRKVSDEFTVPLCPFHHSELHKTGNEYQWWRARNIDPLEIANDLWAQTRAFPGASVTVADEDREHSSSFRAHRDEPATTRKQEPPA